MLKELKLLQQEVSTINKHRISHLKSQHNRLEKRIVKGPSKNYTTYSKGLQTRMKQHLKRVDKSLNVYEKVTRKKSGKYLANLLVNVGVLSVRLHVNVGVLSVRLHVNVGVLSVRLHVNVVVRSGKCLVNVGV